MATATSHTDEFGIVGPYARFIGRVGALAVALGVGAAVATGYGIGVAAAEPESSSDSTQSDDNAASSDGGDTAGTTTAPNETDPGRGTDPSNNDSDGGSGDDEKATRDTGMSFSSSGGLDTSLNDAGQHTDTGTSLVETPKETEVEDVEPVTENDAPDVNVPKTQQDPKAQQDPTPAKPESKPADHDPAPPVTKVDPPPAMEKEIDEPPAANSVQTFALRTSADARTNPDPQPVALRAAAPAPLPPDPMVSFPDAVVHAATTFVSALLAPFVAPGPATPAPPPTLWAVLAWIRDEFRRSFFNSTPVAVNDPVSLDTTTKEDTALTVDVLGNDTDAEGDRILVTSYTQPLHGKVVQNADGTFTYTPNADYHGTDSFTYTVRDRGLNIVEDFVRLITGQGPRTSTATVSLMVTPDNATVVETLPVGRNPVGVEVGYLPDGTLRGYVTNADEGTVTELEYDEETDGWVLGPTIDVGPRPDRILVTDDDLFVLSSGSISVIDRVTRVERARVDYDGDLTDIAVDASHDIRAGVMYAIDSDGVMTAYDTERLELLGTLRLREFDTAPVAFRAAAAAPALTTPPRLAIRADGRVYASVGTRVMAVESRRLAVAARGTAESSAVTRSLRVVDSIDVGGEVTALRASADGRRLLAGVSEQLATGARAERLSEVRVDRAVMALDRSVDASIGGVRGIAISDDGNRAYVTGVDSMAVLDLRAMAVVEKLNTGMNASVAVVPGRDTLLVTDAVGGRVKIVSDPVTEQLTTASDTATLAEDTSVEIVVRANDRTDDAEVPTVNVVRGPVNGTVTVNDDGVVTYTPNENYYGTDTFTYNLVDGDTSSNVSTVTVTVTPVDDPTVISLSWGVSTDLDSHLTGPDGDGRFHVSYLDMTHDEDGVAPIDVQLFNDDLTGTFAERTEIRVLRPGVYHFYVYNYSAGLTGEGNVAGTGAVVSVSDVDDPTLSATFEVADEPGLYWSVFTLTVTEDGQVSIRPDNTYGNEVPPLPEAIDA